MASTEKVIQLDGPLPKNAFEAAKHDLDLAAPGLLVAAALAKAGSEYIGYLEKKALSHAREKLGIYSRFANSPANIEVPSGNVASTEAGLYAFQYQSKLLSTLPESSRTVAASILDTSESNALLAMNLERIMVSDAALSLGDEVRDSAYDFAEQDGVYKTGAGIHSHLSQGLPLTEEHIDQLKSVSGSVLMGAIKTTPLSLLEHPIKLFVSALRESPEGLTKIIGAEFGKQVPDGVTIMSQENIEMSVRSIVASLGLEVGEHFDYGSLATAITAEYAVRHAYELFGVDASGKFVTPKHLERLGVLLEMIGSLDKSQTPERSLLNSDEGANTETSSRRNA